MDKKTEILKIPAAHFTLYSGTCPKCSLGAHAILKVLCRPKPYRIGLPDIIGVVVPPTIVVACQCDIPVTSFPLIYQGPLISDD